ncbi:MAG: hypothetical protein GDA35_10300 [Hyphomonadaceae bacterium]|nr:hypothetical protein [Hyphomonadaceae bacterium]
MLVGSIVGDKLIGGAKGKVVGTVAGGSAGYAAGDRTQQCAGATIHTEQEYGTVTLASTTTSASRVDPIVYRAPANLALHRR